MAELKATVLKNLPLAKASLQFRVLQHPSLASKYSVTHWNIRWSARLERADRRNRQQVSLPELVNSHKAEVSKSERYTMRDVT